ncbi:MAG: GNAT family N-acetyltransferase [Thermoplasmata archaeon]
MRLRPLIESDARAFHAILRDRQVTRFLPPGLRHESGRHFVDRVLAEHKRGGAVPFVIVPRNTTEVAGEIRLFRWSRAERRAEVGYWLRRRYWGRGFGTDALRAICRFGFRSMSLHRIDATIVAGNVGSRRILEKVGFCREGRARQAALLPDGWADEWSFGLLRGELRAD